MAKTIIKTLDREKFNNLVMEQEKGEKKLGIKKVDSCVFYSYIDKKGNIVQLFVKNDR